MKEALLIFARNLIYGQVKTRLAATVGNDVAISVYKQLLEHTVSISNYLPVDKIIFYSDYIEDAGNSGLYKKQIQTGNDLGERMYNAFATVFNSGYDKVVIIGTDCFELRADIIMNAFVYLNDYDVVIGPASDGGYYLLGANKLQPELFQDISWSTNKVLQQTLAVCERLHLSIYLLNELSDIDDENDLKNRNGQFLLKH